LNLAVSFDGSGSSDPDGTIDSYAWDFGDGSTGTGATPTHTYTGAGTFTVGLTVTDNQGGSSSCSTTATIEGENQSPVCDAGGPYNGTVNVAVAFDGSGSSDPDGTVDSYAWDFGDGSTGTGATPSHTYTSANTFTVTLTVTDNEGASSTCTTTANITEEPNDPPVCDANGPYAANVGQSITFDGTGSSDPDGTVDSYAWDFGDGGTGTGPTPIHTYNSAGTFQVTLTVTDNEGASSTCTSTANITGTGGNQPPDCSDAVASRSEIWPPNGQFTRVSVTGVTDPDGDPITIHIDEVTQDEPLSGPGYGNSCPDARLNGNLELRAERGGQGNGRVYEISFTASDGQGGTCSGTVTVCIPHDQGHHECIDSGQNFDSLGPCDLPRGGEDTAGRLMLSATLASGGVQVDYELAQDSKVDISVFDVTGRRLAVLVNSQQTQGAHQLSWDAQGVARGVYYMRIETPTGNLVRRIVLVR
jgi:PKD repeat protein